MPAGFLFELANYSAKMGATFFGIRNIMKFFEH